jgi:hypothetical protein
MIINCTKCGAIVCCWRKPREPTDNVSLEHLVLCLELEIPWRLSKATFASTLALMAAFLVCYKAQRRKMKAPMPVCCKGSNEDEGMGTLTVNKIICTKKPKPYNLPRWYCWANSQGGYLITNPFCKTSN